MREIKFRAWDKQHKRIIHGDNLELVYNENVCLNGQIGHTKR